MNITSGRKAKTENKTNIIFDYSIVVTKWVRFNIKKKKGKKDPTKLKLEDMCLLLR